MRALSRNLAAGIVAGMLAACSSSDGGSSGGGPNPIDDPTDTGGTTTTGTTTAATDGGTTGSDGTTTGTTTGSDGTTTGTTTGSDGTTTGTTTGSDGTTTGTTTGSDGTSTGTTTGSDGTTTGTTTGSDGTTTGTTTGSDGTTTGTDSGTTTGGTDGTDVGSSDFDALCTDVASGLKANECTYNRTLTEVLSVRTNGPSRADAGRTDNAPSAPTGLVALLTAENWIELDWVPSADDNEVVAYEIFRDGAPVALIDGEGATPDTDPRVEEVRALRTTSYIDCNFTKDINCQTVGQPQPGMSHTYTVVAIDDTGLRSAFSEPATFRMNSIQGSAAPDPLAEGYTLAFGDDFDDVSLDRDNWHLKMPWGPDTIINKEGQYFVDAFANQSVLLPYNPFEMTTDAEAEDGRVLKINAIATPPALLERANNQPYLSGVITTRTKPSGSKRYGFVEIRAKVPTGAGLLSTFYLYQASGNQYEIDILEFLGNEPNGATQNYHYRDGFRFADTAELTGSLGVAHASPTMFHRTETDLRDGFHTYSVLWEPERVIWFIDGIEVRRMTGPRVSNQPMDIVAQLVVGGPNNSFVGEPSGDELPASYEIDYIRHWQK